MLTVTSSSLLASSLILFHTFELFLCIEHNPPTLLPLPNFPKGPVSIHENRSTVILCDEAATVQLFVGFQFLLLFLMLPTVCDWTSVSFPKISFWIKAFDKMGRSQQALPYSCHYCPTNFCSIEQKLQFPPVYQSKREVPYTCTPVLVTGLLVTAGAWSPVLVK